jgi:hypothetical protein
MPTEAEIIAKGKSDYYAFKGVYKNPYPMASQEFNHYERGWTQSLKFDGGRLVEMSNKPAPLPVVPTQAPTYNAYAEQKGRSKPR